MSRVCKAPFSGNVVLAHWDTVLIFGCLATRWLEEGSGRKEISGFC